MRVFFLNVILDGRDEYEKCDRKSFSNRVQRKAMIFLRHNKRNLSVSFSVSVHVSFEEWNRLIFHC